MTTQPAVKVEELKSLRANNKGNITRIFNHVSKGKKLSIIELECRLGLLENYFKQASFYQTSIEKAIPSDLGQADIDEAYICAKSTILAMINEQRDPTQHDQSIVSQTTSSHRLPILQFPKFDGKYAEYKNFMSSFRSLVHNDTGLSTIEKFNHLLACLSGEALQAVKAFPISRENYPKALERLTARYDNDTLIFLENISSLFELEKAIKSDAKHLRNIVDTISALYNSLKSLGSFEQICDAFIIHLAISKVDSATKQKWNESLNFSELPKWIDCCAMLDKRCQQLEAQGRNNDKPQGAPGATITKPKRTSLVSSAASEKGCNYCLKSGHNIVLCQQFLALSLEQRFHQAKQQRLCINCLGKGHIVSNCQSKGSCKVCKQRHHTLLHRSKDNQTPPAGTGSSTLPEPVSLPTTSTATVQTTTEGTNDATKGQVILATAVVLVRDRKGEVHMARVLLDSCSQVNFMTETLAQSLELSKSKNQTQILGIGSTAFNVHYKSQATVRSRLNNFEMSLEFLVSSKITGYHPESSVSSILNFIPKNIELADPQFYRPQKIDLLLGAEAFFQLLSVGQIQLGNGLPTLQKTLFGWVVSGRCNNSTALIATMDNDEHMPFETLNKALQKFWELEAVDTKRRTLTSEQQECENHFGKNVSRDFSGRIIVRLPLKADPHILGNSFDIAHRRFLMLEKRMQRNADLKAGYIKFMREYEDLKHMTIYEQFDSSNPHYFIPHHSVMKPDSETTKLRVVFDASCRTSSQQSLNDIMMVGPTVQNELLITLIRFRCHQYGLTADVTKMYRQVLVHDKDRELQLILWREDPSLPLKIYKLNTVTYGTASAPYLAIKSLQYATQEFTSTHHIGKKVILNDFYVDDMLTGSDDLGTLTSIKSEVSEIMIKSQFSLSKWHCSHEAMNCLSTGKDIAFDDDITSALGITWHPKRDEFKFRFKPKIVPKVISKRAILSITSSLFDPLGLLSPLVVPAKIIIQRLWLHKCDWDESVPQQIQTSWNSILSEFEKVHHISIPRFVRIPHCTELQVHGFGDASMKAYGCCLYFRCVDNSGNVKVHLLASKSRVAPARVVSLPRLELCAAHLLTTFWNKIRTYIPYNVSQVHFWSDSQIVLHWVDMHSSLLSTFVANRVAEIQTLSHDAHWHHVTSKNNPADLISRGCTVEELKNSQWIHGPPFLSQHPDRWPSLQPSQLTESERLLERKRSSLVIEERPVSHLLHTAHKFSNHLKCLRVFSYVLRWIKGIRPHTTTITSNEIHLSLLVIISIVQQHHFHREILELQKNNFVQGSHASLSLFLDTSNNFVLLRVGGRLRNADLPESTKHPLLMPKHDPFVKTLVTHVHRSNYHSGPKALVAQLQERFWIINCKSVVRQIVNNCITCCRYRPKLSSQIMGQLPKDRVRSNRPFETCGVDFAGPVVTYHGIRGKPPFKSYIALFVCFTTKAVHLESVPNLSTEAFINALKRFIGRRGLPAKIYCDNATNFVGAAARLKELRNHFFASTNISSIQSFCATSSIEFSFIPPRAPHFGGLWEAAVKIAKSLLYRTFFNAHLTLEELRTALVEIEAIMNSRPIAPLSTCPNDLQALTPGHFLIGQPLRSLPEPMNVDVDVSHLDRFQRITALKAHFWKRWHKEYLLDMQNKNRWKKPQRSIKMNDLVVIHDDNLHPMSWPLGRIVRVIPGADGHVRVAEIKTATTVLRRPITKLALLPTD